MEDHELLELLAILLQLLAWLLSTF